MKKNINDLNNELIKTLKNNNKLFDIKKMIKGLLHRKLILNDIAFWPNSLIIYAFSLMNTNYSNSLIINQFNIWKKRKFHINNYDDILMSYIFLKNSQLFSKKDIENMITSSNNSINEFKNKDIPYRPKLSEDIYIDLLGMVPQYLCLYGSNYDDESYIDWAIKIFGNFVANAFDSNTGLPYHAYDYKTLEKKGIIGWGRSVGWILFGLSESIIVLKKSSNKKYKLLLNYYLDILNRTLKYLRNDGGLAWQLFSLDGHLDTSATSLVLLSILNLKDNLLIKHEYEAEIKKMYNCLISNIKEGKVTNCSAECGGLGVYPQKYDSYAWSVGPTLACILISNKINDEEVE